MNFKCEDPKNTYKLSCFTWPAWSKAAAAIKSCLHGLGNWIDSMAQAFGPEGLGIPEQTPAIAPRPSLNGEKSRMKKGSVKWFNEKKGFGFIEGDDGNTFFVHYSEIQVEGFRTLYEGQRVQFESDHGPKGLAALQVRII